MYKNVPLSALGKQGLEADESKPKAAKQKMVKDFKAKQQIANSIIEHVFDLSLNYVSYFRGFSVTGGRKLQKKIKTLCQTS